MEAVDRQPAQPAQRERLHRGQTRRENRIHARHLAVRATEYGQGVGRERQDQRHAAGYGDEQHQGPDEQPHAQGCLERLQ